MSNTTDGIVSAESAPERSSVAPVAFPSFPPASPEAPSSRVRWVVTSMLPVLSFVLAGAVAYAAPPPKYAGPPAEPAIALPDVIVLAPAGTQAEPCEHLGDTVTPADSSPSVWVYDLPVAGNANNRKPAHANALPLTVSVEQLPLAR